MTDVEGKLPTVSIGLPVFNGANYLEFLLNVNETHSDPLISLDDHGSLLLKNFVAGNLHVSDFIITNHGLVA